MARSAAERSAHFDTAQAARIVGVTPRRLRQCVGAGLLVPPRDPRGRMRFGFVDLVVLRTMRGLIAKGIAVPQIARVLHSLRRQIGDRPLTRLTAGLNEDPALQAVAVDVLIDLRIVAGRRNNVARRGATCPSGANRKGARRREARPARGGGGSHAAAGTTDRYRIAKTI